MEGIIVEVDGFVPLRLDLISIQTEDGDVLPGLPGVKRALSLLSSEIWGGRRVWVRGDQWIAATDSADDGRYIVGVGLERLDGDDDRFVVHDVTSALCGAILTGDDAVDVVREAERRGQNA